jgi:uncharacterized protein (DUF2267 family)
MPYPHEYTVAADKFAAFLRDVKEGAAIAFANILPVGMRALFVADWDVDEERLPFTDLETMNKEVRLLRPDHNFATEQAIQQVSSAMKKHVDNEMLETLLKGISKEALAFWQIG